MVLHTNLVDYYAQHLAEVNRNNSVIANENIYNSDGLLLLRKGASFQLDAVDKILNFELTKPLDESVCIETPLNGNDIYGKINELIREFSFVEKMHYFSNVNLLLKQQCRLLEQYELIMQKITVQSIRQPNEFMSSLMCAWMSLGIAKLMRLKPVQVHSVFVAALTHDVGMLHIAPRIIENKGELDADDWKEMQSHVEISDYILKRVRGLPKAARLAVTQHHERCDGMGYPKGLLAQDLNIEGQIVAMADSLIAMIIKEINEGNSKRINVIPFLQLNSEAHFYETYEVLINWMRNVGYTEVRSIPDADIESVLDGVFCEEYFLNKWLNIVAYIIEVIPEDSENQRLNAVITAKGHLDKILNASGLVDVGYIRWLKQVKEEHLKSAYGEVEHASLMLKEVRWELRHITRTLKVIYKNVNELDDDLLRRLSKGFRKLKLLNQSYNTSRFRNASKEKL